MDVKFIRPLNDFAFKVLWLNGNQKTKKYLRRIIDNITNLDLSLFANDNQELGGNNYASIASRTDLLLTSKDKKIKLNIEVNNTYTTTIYNKNKTYILKIGGNFYNDLNEKYIDDIKVIQVNLNNFIYKEQNIKKTSFYFYDPINKIEDKSLEIHHIYLPHFKNICYDTNSDINNDFAMLTCESYEEMKKYIGKNEERKSFMEELKNLSSDDVFANLYDVEEFRQAQEKEIRTKATEQGMKEGYIQGFEQGSKEGFEQGSKEGFEQGSKEGFEQGSKEGFDQGIEQGIEDGIEIKTKDDAINLYHNGVSEDVICKSLNITPEKLQIYIKASN